MTTQVKRMTRYVPLGDARYPSQKSASLAAKDYREKGYVIRIVRRGGRGVTPHWQLYRTLTPQERADLESGEAWERGGATTRKFVGKASTALGRAAKAAGREGEKIGRVATKSIFRKVAEQQVMEDPTQFRWRRRGSIGSRLPSRQAPIGQMPSGRIPISKWKERR